MDSSTHSSVAGCCHNGPAGEPRNRQTCIDRCGRCGSITLRTSIICVCASWTDYSCEQAEREVSQRELGDTRSGGVLAQVSIAPAVVCKRSGRAVDLVVRLVCISSQRETDSITGCGRTLREAVWRDIDPLNCHMPRPGIPLVWRCAAVCRVSSQPSDVQSYSKRYLFDAPIIDESLPFATKRPGLWQSYGFRCRDLLCMFRVS